MHSPFSRHAPQVAYFGGYHYTPPHVAIGFTHLENRLKYRHLDDLRFSVDR
jgi:hypothetical protein